MDFSTRTNDTALQTEAPGPDRRKHPPPLRMHGTQMDTDSRGARRPKRRRPSGANRAPPAGRSEGGGAAKGPTGARRGPRRGAARASGGAGGQGAAHGGAAHGGHAPCRTPEPRATGRGGTGPRVDGRRARTGAGSDPGRNLNARRIPMKPGAQAPWRGRARAGDASPPRPRGAGGRSSAANIQRTGSEAPH